MDPITLAALISLGKTILTSDIAKELAKSTATGILPSYIAAYIPLLNKPTVKKAVDKAYKNAVKRWKQEGGDCREAYANKIESSESLKNLMLGGAPEAISIANTIAKYWWEEMDRDEACWPLVQKVRLEDVVKVVKENLSVAKDTNHLVHKVLQKLDEFKTIGKTNFEEPNGYIKRYCEESNADFFRLAQLENEAKTVIDFLIGGESDRVPQIILFANPQMGKSTELAHLGYTLQSTSQFLPVLFPMKVIVSPDILPQVDSVDGKSVVLLIDAFDEVSELDMSKSLSILRVYADKHPFVRIIVTCRQNFEYMNSTLKFSPYHLSKLSANQISEIVNNNALIPNKEDFFYAINKNGLKNVVSCPFYLKSIMDLYAKRGEMPQFVSDIYGYLVDESYRVEEELNINDEHFTKEEEYKILQEAALVTLMVNNNMLTSTDLKTLLDDEHKKFHSNLHFGVLDYKKENDSFSFAYNELCEYVAATYLATQPLEKVQVLVCANESKRIRSRWDNVIRLYVEIKYKESNGVLPEDVLEWLKAENDKVLVQLSPIVLSKEERVAAVINYLEKQKSNDKFINNFSAVFQFDHIMTFGLSEAVLEYFIKEISTSTQIGNHQYNIIMLVACIDWEWVKQFAPNMEEPLVNALESLEEKGLYNDDNKWLKDVWKYGRKQAIAVDDQEENEPVVNVVELTGVTEEQASTYKAKRKAKKSQDVKQLLEEAVFIDLVSKEIAEQRPMPWKVLFEKSWIYPEEINIYVLNFLSDYTYKDGDTVYVDNDQALGAVRDHGKYQAFCHSQIVPHIIREDDEVELVVELQEGILKWAQAQLYALVQVENADTLTLQDKLCIELMLHGEIKVDSKYYGRLLDYSRWPFESSVDSIYDEWRTPMFDYLQNSLSKSDFDNLVREKILNEWDSSSDQNFCVWVKYAISQRISEIERPILERIEKDHNVRFELLPVLALSSKFRPAVKELAERNMFYQDDIITLAKTLSEMNEEKAWVKQYIETHWDWLKQSHAKEAMILLLKLGSFHGLEELKTDPCIIELAGIVTFNYDDVKALTLLCDLFEIYLPKKQIPDPCMSILATINALAIVSKEDLLETKERMKKLSDRLPEYKNFVDNWLIDIDDTYCNIQFKNNGIEEALGWIRM